MSELTVVVPSWNTIDLLRTCLQKVCVAELPSTTIVVVDNGSTDGSPDMVAAEFPDAVLIRNPRNEGFAIACNQGMRRAEGEWVLLLNSDTEVAPDAVAKLVAWLREHPDYGAAAPRLVNPDGSTQESLQAFPGWRTPFFFGTPMERWAPDSKELRRYFERDHDYSRSCDVRQPPAAVLLLRRSMLDEIGLFDESLWLFYNDVDLSLRMSQAGWRTRYVHDSVVLHHEGASTSTFGKMLRVWQKDRLLYYRKHFGRVGGWWVKLNVGWAMADFVCVQLIKRYVERTPDAQAVRPVLRDFGAFLAR